MVSRQGIDWYKLERQELSPPIQLTFESPTDTHYFDDKFKNYPLEDVTSIVTTNGGTKYHDYTFVCDAFCEDASFSPIINSELDE